MDSYSGSPGSSSPIRTLPVEVLTEIFGYCSSKSPSSHAVTLTRPGELDVPIQAVSSTCSKWRSIVCTQSTFWSSYDLNLTYITGPKIFDLLIMYIGRSGTAKLRLGIACPEMNADQGSETSQSSEDADLLPTRLAFLAVLLDNSSRWHDVFLDMSSSVFAYAVSRLELRGKPKEDGYFPNLEKLYCQDQESEHYYLDGDPETGRSLFDIFQPCPRLRDLTAHDSWVTDPIDYSHLTNLDLMFYRGRSLSTLLSRCPNLKEFSLAYCSIPDEDDFDYDESARVWSKNHPFSHRSLVTLILPMYEHFGCAIWEDLCFPSVNTLTIDQIGDDEAGMAELVDLVSRSRCNLRTMAIGKMPLGALFKLLSIAPSLERLKLARHYTVHAWETNPTTMFLPLFKKETQHLVPALSLQIELGASSFVDRPATRDVPQHIHDMVVSRLGEVPTQLSFVVTALESKQTMELNFGFLFEFFGARFRDITQPLPYETYSLALTLGGRGS
ncbi:hypothetical protein BDP27DRAFT_1449119 [Rhodocollybia butyracea]|uniref:F-box domain-containing protein n=1 Tax=Rhodocollybia butyracea TaxID=206335 RepID=A0A9P5U5S3_9AGAR|nr:hypothetical protein BDP27DRAFT_1449119 [Rhodocollybia butyracea]